MPCDGALHVVDSRAALDSLDLPPMFTPRLRHGLALVALLAPLAACKDAAKETPTSSASPSASAAPAQPSVTASAQPSATPAASGSALAADANGALTLAWKGANAGGEKVTVSVVAANETIPLGTLDGTSDDPQSGLASCAMRSPSPTTSTFGCGGTPAYNFYTATLKGGELVISLSTGVDGEPSSEKVKEVARRTTAATSLRPSGPASPALYGNCRPGSVQTSPTAPCMRQCLKGTECKGTDKCTFVTVKGTDGDHRVHACVPAGK